MKQHSFLRLIILIPIALWRMLWSSHPVMMKRIVLSVVICGIFIIGGFAYSVHDFAGCTKETTEISFSQTAEELIYAETTLPATLPQSSVSITLSFAGDCTLGMDESFYYPSSFCGIYDANGPAYFLEDVRDIFLQDDYTVVNLEGTLTNSVERTDKEWAFKGSPEYTEVLTSGGVDCANLANNHCADYGINSYGDTKAALEGVELDYFGVDKTLVTEIKGIQVGFVGMYTVHNSGDEKERLEDAITELREQGAKIIIANFHWGLELDTIPEEEQISLAHSAIDLGAHLVIGHHPHVLQGIESYQGRYIVYSLGNFCFGGNSDPTDYDTMIFQQRFTLSEDSIDTSDISIIPCSISSRTDLNNYQPTIAEGTEAERILQKIETLSSALTK